MFPFFVPKHFKMFRWQGFIFRLSGTELHDDRVFDGYDISPLLLGTGKSQRDVVFYEYSDQSAHPITDPPTEIHHVRTAADPPLLYNVNIDPSEKFNITEEHPEVISPHHLHSLCKKIIFCLQGIQVYAGRQTAGINGDGIFTRIVPLRNRDIHQPSGYIRHVQFNMAAGP